MALGILVAQGVAWTRYLLPGINEPGVRKNLVPTTTVDCGSSDDEGLYQCTNSQSDVYMWDMGDDLNII